MVRLRDARRPREGIPLTQFLDAFAPDEIAAEAWLVARRWPEGVRCANCDSTRIAERQNRRPQPYWCHDSSVEPSWISTSYRRSDSRS